MASVYTLSGTSASVDLTAPTTDIGTVTPPSIVVSTLFRSANTGNVPFVAQPFGTGAFQLQPTDNTVTGGNARGANSVDLQTKRSAANQVVSGTSSFAAGQGNIVSGNDSGSMGSGNISSGGTSSFTLGSACTAAQNYTFAGGIFANATGTGGFAYGFNANASGNYSTAFGSCPSTKSVYGLFAIGSRLVGTTGKAQSNQLNVTGSTTDATPKVLNSEADAGSANSANQLALQDNSALTFTALVVATIVGAGNTSSWKFEGCIKRGSGVASTVLVAAVTPVLIAQNAGASTWSIAVTADITNGCLAVTVTGQAATTIRWNCTLYASEVAF